MMERSGYGVGLGPKSILPFLEKANEILLRLSTSPFGLAKPRQATEAPTPLAKKYLPVPLFEGS